MQREELLYMKVEVYHTNSHKLLKKGRCSDSSDARVREHLHETSHAKGILRFYMIRRAFLRYKSHTGALETQRLKMLVKKVRS